MESILNSVKKDLGIAEEYTSFDPDIIRDINSVLAILNQLGVGPKEGFSIEDKSALWSDFIQETNRLEFVKSYVYIKVKMIFDPPLSTAVIASMERIASELEWRITVAAEK